ncbi:nucleoside-diphosphate-sugar epimerase [Rhodoferax ferrireducens]|uniref:Nucleoside-diphosphate-sugar epimerase n=1 Tax=Rhodoferax ferrireducens TaxID=192843 RepID=A0ABU2CFG1_9BURK|nr:D-erythronate dehydrogenase [Rhodoferax ferrireducens]MDR7380063.1 nucleoside-diphosphate-sugar epimerase [Rhodoferax ferrireducens]
MNILITGGCGFLGLRLARALLAHGALSLAGAAPQPIARLVLADRFAPPADLVADPRVVHLAGDLHALLASAELVKADTALVFHLAAAVSGECEADLDLGLHSNLDATLGLLQACRRLGTAPVFVFSSSVAVFGSTSEQPLPAVIEDHTLPTPQNSYGIQKFIGEQLVTDFSRRGLVQGRNVRLMTVAVRPGKPNAAASSFLSGMLREPLAGQRANVPVAADTLVALSSPTRTVQGLLRAAQASAAEWGARTAVNLPALTTSVGAMAQALADIAGPAATALLDWVPDTRVAAIVTAWPSRVHSARANALGLLADASFNDILHEYVQENPAAVQLPLLET